MVRFLWSVRSEDLDGEGFAVTLTMGGTPDTAQEWAAARRQMLQWLGRAGAVRWHWLTEWTRSGRPHMHLCVYGVSRDRDRDVALAWIRLSRKRGWPAEWRAQTVEPIYDAEGWLKYVAKHSARGVDHYQRTAPPPGWEKTGRLWGRGGDWPIADPLIAGLSSAQTWAYRAALVSWQSARMRAEGVPEEVVARYESRDDHQLRGASGWIPEDASVMLLLNATESPDYGPNDGRSE